LRDNSSLLVATPNLASPTRRLSDLQRSAFWIYGVTAMVMREPLGLVIRHTSDAGLNHWQVRLELLRVAVILLLLARLFLRTGLYFERVYMQPDSNDRFPRRSYPTDFLAGLMLFLVGAAATTAVGTHTRVFRAFAPFTVAVACFLLVDTFWWALARLRGFSSTALIRDQAVTNLGMLAASLTVWSLAYAAGADAVLSDQIALGIIGIGTAADVVWQARTYESLDR